jgi:hypothetical protein
MNRLAGFLLTASALVGCNTNPPPAAPPPAKAKVEVHAPGVDVNVGKGKVDVQAPGTDVQVEPKNRP